MDLDKALDFPANIALENRVADNNVEAAPGILVKQQAILHNPPWATIRRRENGRFANLDQFGLARSRLMLEQKLTPVTQMTEIACCQQRLLVLFGMSVVPAGPFR